MSLEGHETIEGDEVDAFLADALPVESISLIAQLGARLIDTPIALLTLRVPGFDHNGLGQHSAADYSWNIARGDGDDVWAVLMLRWPNGQERKIKFDLQGTTRRFFRMVIEQYDDLSVVTIGITATPSGVPVGLTTITMSVLGDDVFGALYGLAEFLERGGKLDD